jgi:adenylate kinase
MALYEEQTAPLLDIYGARGLVTKVDALGAFDEVTARILAALAERGIREPASDSSASVGSSESVA